MTKKPWKTFKCYWRDRHGRLLLVDELTTSNRYQSGDSIILGGLRGVRDYFVVLIDGDKMIVDEVHG